MDATACGGEEIHAADLAARGDRIGAKFELAEAGDLERDASDILHPLMHTTAPVQIGRGGELATGAAIMQPFLIPCAPVRTGSCMTPAASGWNWRAAPVL